MATASFELDTRDMVRLVTKVRDRAPRAISRALNKSAKSAKTAMVKAVREDMGLKARDVNKGLIFRASRPSRDPVAKIEISPFRVPLIKFGGTQLKRAGYKSRLKGGSGTIPHAFEATMKSGHVGVFKRAGKERLKINELFGPSIGKVFAKKWRVGVKRFREQLPKNLRNEIRFASRGR